MVEEEHTCGRGLAEQAPLPDAFAELMASVAEVLHVHMQALDVTDANAKIEHEAYAGLVEQHRAVAEQLRATGEALTRCRTLPVARHDPDAMASNDAVTTFSGFVQAERQLLGLLQKRLPGDEQMLVAMGGSSL